MTSAHPAYAINTPRLLLRCCAPADAREFRALIDRNDAHLRPWIPWMRDEPMSLDDTIRRLRRDRARFDLDQDYRYTAYTQEGELVGLVGLHPRVGPAALEIGYLLDAAAAGKGYALEMASAMVRVAFELHKVKRLEVHCDPANVPSAAIPRKLGFTHEATRRRSAENSDGAICDVMIWTLFNDEYPYSRAASLPLLAEDSLGQPLPLLQRDSESEERAPDQKSSASSV